MQQPPPPPPGKARSEDNRKQRGPFGISMYFGNLTGSGAGVARDLSNNMQCNKAFPLPLPSATHIRRPQVKLTRPMGRRSNQKSRPVSPCCFCRKQRDQVMLMFAWRILERAGPHSSSCLRVAFNQAKLKALHFAGLPRLSRSHIGASQNLPFIFQLPRISFDLTPFISPRSLA